MRATVLALLTSCSVSLSGCGAVMTAAASHSAAILAVADAAPVAVAIGAVSTIGVAGAVRSPREVYEAGTLGKFLQDGLEAARLSTTRAAVGQDDLGMVVSLQTRRAIVRTRAAYVDKLDQKTESLSASEKGQLSDISMAVEALGATQGVTKRSAGIRVQAMADRLRLPDGFPQVQSFGPVYLLPFLPVQSVTVRGTFPSLYPEGSSPQLKIGGRTYKPYDFNSQSLAFSVRTEDLVSEQSTAVTWHLGDLTIPWTKPLFDPLSGAGNENVLAIAVLPNTLGYAILETEERSVHREEGDRSSANLELGPANPAVADQKCLILSSQDISQGWQFVQGSSRAGLVSQGATAFPEDGAKFTLGAESGQSVCWSVTVPERAAGAERPVDGADHTIAFWKIVAKVSRQRADSRVTSERFDLSWGSNRTISRPAGARTLRYAKYGGPPVVWDPSASADPLLRVESDARQMRISVYPF